MRFQPGDQAERQPVSAYIFAFQPGTRPKYSLKPESCIRSMFKRLWPTACLKIRTAFSKSGVVTKTFAPKFCAEWSDREVHSSHGDHFRDNFFVYVSEPCFGAQKLTPSLGALSRGPRPRKMSSSQSCSHRNSVQNGPIERSTALTGTTFVTISVFMPR